MKKPNQVYVLLGIVISLLLIAVPLLQGQMIHRREAFINRQHELATHLRDRLPILKRDINESQYWIGVIQKAIPENEEDLRDALAHQREPNLPNFLQSRYDSYVLQGYYNRRALAGNLRREQDTLRVRTNRLLFEIRRIDSMGVVITHRVDSTMGLVRQEEKEFLPWYIRSGYLFLPHP